DIKPQIEQKILSLKGAIESNDLQRIKSGMEELQRAMHEVSARMYGQQSGPQPGYQTGQTYTPPHQTEEEQYRKASGQDEVVDADYEVA
ncbi:MAG: molecular chaperone DnaK, partial [Candidatus Hodarchaeota archaeon]